jgi:uncharacterized membrane protein YsdA (DUF1294 family)
LGTSFAAVIAVYLVASVSSLIAYGIDKSAAGTNRRRVRESTLHWLAVFGGWPGAMLAQRLFRHKTQKRSFRRIFWLTVVVNVIVAIVVVRAILH